MIKKYINVLSYIISILFGIVLISNKLLPINLKYGLIFLIIIILLISKRHNWIKVYLSIVLILAVVPMIYAQRIVETALNKVEYEVQNFSLYVLNDSKYYSINDFDSNYIAYPNQIELEFQDVISYQWIDLKLNYIVTENPIQAAENLLNGKVQAVLLDNSTIETIEEFGLNFTTKVRIIENYQKEIVRDELNKPKDIRKSPFIVYISGLDVAGPINTVSRSDVNILVAVHPSFGIVDMYSIARDSYFPIACMDDNYDKLTHAGWKGLDCSINTLENVFDLEVNYYIKVNFTSFMNIIDLFGTIEVNSPYSFSSGGYSFKKGINLMDAKKALAFSRERKSFSLGDLQRGLNQQEVIKALIKRIMEIRDIKTLNRLVEQVGKYVDTNINSDDLGKLLDLQISENPSWNITTHMLEGERGSAPSYAFGGQYHNMVFPNLDSVQEITQNIDDLMNKR